MTTEAILETVAYAARLRRTVSVLLNTEAGSTQIEVEPYSIARRKQHQTFFCWDLTSGRVVGVPLDALTEVTPTGREFTPRYEVEF